MWSKKLLWLIPAIITGLLPLRLLSPVLPIVEQRFWAHGHSCDLNSNDSVCKDALSQVSLANSIASSSGTMIGFLIAPVVGRFSDSFCRRPVFIVSSALRIFSPVCLLLYSLFGTSLYFYYASVVLSSVGMSPELVAYLAFIADVSTPEQRKHSFGVVLGAFSLCAIVGPILGVCLPEHYNFITVVALAGANLLYLALCLPETLPHELRQPFARGALNPLSSFAILNRHALFRRLATLICLSYSALMGLLEVSQLYSRARFHFGPQENAVLSEIWGGTGIVTQFVLLPCLVGVLPNRRILQLGLAAQTAAIVGQGLAPSRAVLFAFSGLSALGSLTFPSVSAIKSLNASDDEQGTLQGALGGVQQLAAVAGQLGFGALFSLGNARDLPQLPYFVGASLVAAALLISFTLPPGADSSAHATDHGQGQTADESQSLNQPITSDSDQNQTVGRVSQNVLVLPIPPSRRGSIQDS